MTVTTVYADTDDGNNTSGSSVFGTYASARDGTVGVTTDTTGVAAFVGQQYTGVIYYCLQQGERFDTSSIPDADTVSNADLSVYGVSGSAVGNMTSLEARLYNWSSGGYTSADWRTGSNLSGDTLLGAFNTAGWSISAYNQLSDVAFAANVNKTGSTYIIMNSSRNVGSGTAPTGNEFVYISTADESGTTQDPKLVVTHAAASSLSKSTIVRQAVKRASYY